MSKHTPGPWEFDDGEILAGGMPVATVYGFNDFPCLDLEADEAERVSQELSANAYAIAAVPELYAACATMRLQHEMLRGKCPCIVCEAARKAEGTL